MGAHKHFGNLVTNSRGIISFALSPYEQKAFGGFFSKGAKNTARRIVENIPYVAPGIVSSILVYKLGLDSFNAHKRKDPSHYVNES